MSTPPGAPSRRQALVRALAGALAGLLVVGGLVSCREAPERADGDPATGTAVTDVADARGTRPNIVLLSSDDQTDTELEHMPLTRSLLAEAGTEFTDAISPHPLCCPARAEILTGEYAQNNGVRHNRGAYGGYQAFARHNTEQNLAAWLHDAGYRTGFVGKTLNSYTTGSRRMRGWDYWSPTIADTYRYYGTRFYDDGRPRTYDGYVADVVRDQAVDLVERWSAGDRPFFVWASHVGPHDATESDGTWGPPVPAERHRGLFSDVDLPSADDPSFDEPDTSDKPPAVRRGRDGVPVRTEWYRDRLRSLQAVDEANAAVIEALDRAGELDDTVVVYVSDNGFLTGQHRIYGKNYPYEEDLQVPFVLRGPGVPGGTTSAETATIVDLAPTFLDLAGVLGDVRSAGHTDGESLLPALRGGSLGATSLIQAGTSGRRELRAFGWSFRGVRTPRFTWVRWWDGAEELYDRELDPFQESNLVGPDGQVRDPAYAAVREELERRYRALRWCRGVAECERQDFGPEPAPAS